MSGTQDLVLGRTNLLRAFLEAVDEDGRSLWLELNDLIGRFACKIDKPIQVRFPVIGWTTVDYAAILPCGSLSFQLSEESS